MSGPKSYSVVLTAEERARLEKLAEEQRKQAEFNRIVSEFRKTLSDSSYYSKIEDEMSAVSNSERERIAASVAEFAAQDVAADFSSYKEDRIPSDIEISLKKRHEYDAALEDYARICSVLNLDMADCFKYDESRYEELIQQVRAETQRLENLQVQQMQDQLIYETSLKVLAEMGYELIGDKSITKRSGITVKSTLLRLDDDTAVNLTSTSNGQYTFELVSVNNDGHYPTENEISKLFELMCTKCRGDFTIIRKKLAQYGLVMEDVIERDPDISYCRSKNIEDYTSHKQDECEIPCEEKRHLNGEV